MQARVREFALEWRQNRRLRLGALAIVAILGLQLVLWRADARAERVEDYRRGAELLARLESASRESAWIERAAAAEDALQAQRASIPAVDSDVLAQAEMQAWLTDLAAFAGVPGPVVRVENAIAVEGQADMWQVLGRLDGSVPASGIQALVRTVSAAGPWFQAERLELQDGDTPRMSVVLRGYFRKGESAANARRPADLPADVPEVVPGRQVASRANPLAPPVASPVAGGDRPSRAASSDRAPANVPAQSTSRRGATSARRFPPGYRSDDSSAPVPLPSDSRQPATRPTRAPRTTAPPPATGDASGTGSSRRAPPRGSGGGGGAPPGWGGGAA